MNKYNHFMEPQGYVVEDEELKKILLELPKIRHTIIMAEYMFKCRKGLSKKTYGRTRQTHRILKRKYHYLFITESKSEDEAFQKKARGLVNGKKLQWNMR